MVPRFIAIGTVQVSRWGSSGSDAAPALRWTAGYSVRTVSGETLDVCLDWWQQSERRNDVRNRLRELCGIDTEDVIMGPDRARARGLTSTVCFPMGNLAPEGSIIKSTAIAMLTAQQAN